MNSLETNRPRGREEPAEAGWPEDSAHQTGPDRRSRPRRINPPMKMRPEEEPTKETGERREREPNGERLLAPSHCWGHGTIFFTVNPATPTIPDCTSIHVFSPLECPVGIHASLIYGWPHCQHAGAPVVGADARQKGRIHGEMALPVGSGLCRSLYERVCTFWSGIGESER